MYNNKTDLTVRGSQARVEPRGAYDVEVEIEGVLKQDILDMIGETFEYGEVIDALGDGLIDYIKDQYNLVEEA